MWRVQDHRHGGVFLQPGDQMNIGPSRGGMEWLLTGGRLEKPGLYIACLPVFLIR
jgi:hypothetical protein